MNEIMLAFAVGCPLFFGVLAALWGSRNMHKATIIPPWRLALSASFLSAQATLVAVMFMYLAIINMSAFRPTPTTAEIASSLPRDISYLFYILATSALLGFAIGFVRAKRGK